MGTAWTEIVANQAMLRIDDIRLTEEAGTNPAAFFRKMSLYMLGAIPMLECPPTLRLYLENGLSAASYDEYDWTSTTASKSVQTVVATGKTGYEVFSCVKREYDNAGNATDEPYADAAYDAATGNVTFPIQSDEGIEYIMDFYKDGRFTSELSLSIKKLLGQAIAVLWDERFDNNWLDNTLKIHDANFTTVNESNYMNSKGARHGRKYAEFVSEMRKYEQDCAAVNAMSANTRTGNFFL